MKPALDNTSKGPKMLSDSNLPPAPPPMGSSSVSSEMTKGLKGSLGAAKNHLKKHATGAYHKTRG